MNISNQTPIDLTNYYYDPNLFSQTNAVPEVFSLAFLISDINKDNATDLLVMNITENTSTNSFSSQIFALCGMNGSTLWQKNYPDSLAYAFQTGDLNGDGQTDIIVDEVIAGTSFLPYSNVAALDGSNGTQIWSRQQIFAITIAYTLKDNPKENASELMLHIFGIDSLNNTVFTKISRVNAVNGKVLEESLYYGAVAIKYPAGNFTKDIIQDSVAAIYMFNESEQNISTTLEAVDSKEHKILWNRTFESLAMAIPIQDLTGDGHDELLVYQLENSSNDTINCRIDVIQGSDGELLWQKFYENSLAYAIVEPDLTGDGNKDLIIYRMDESHNNELTAVQGNNGRQLWNKTGLLIMQPLTQK